MSAPHTSLDAAIQREPGRQERCEALRVEVEFDAIDRATMSACVEALART